MNYILFASNCSRIPGAPWLGLLRASKLNKRNLIAQYSRRDEPRNAPEIARGRWMMVGPWRDPGDFRRSGVEPIVLVLSCAATVLVIDTNLGTAAQASVAMC